MPYMPPGCVLPDAASVAALETAQDQRVQWRGLDERTGWGSSREGSPEGFWFESRLPIERKRERLSMIGGKATISGALIRGKDELKGKEVISDEVSEKKESLLEETGAADATIRVVDSMGLEDSSRVLHNVVLSGEDIERPIFCDVVSGRPENTKTWSDNWESAFKEQKCIWGPWENCYAEEQKTYASESTHLKKVLSSLSFTCTSYMHTEDHEGVSMHAGRGTGEGGMRRVCSSVPLSGGSVRMEGGQNLLRKKSGELVKSSLKSEKHARPLSMPSTPILHKNVQFATKLEQVRHFSQAEKPTAVGTRISPEEKEYNHNLGLGHEMCEGWDEEELVIELANFSQEEKLCVAQNVQLETVYLSGNKRNLLGRIAVKNLAFEKSVGVRFTTDHWQTISEVNAEYMDGGLMKKPDDDLDRFIFNIKLHELVNINEKTLYLCIRYTIPGGEFWDNNLGMNYRIEFRMRRKMREKCLTHFRTMALGDQELEEEMNSDLSMFRSYKDNSFHMPLTNNNANTRVSFLRKKDNTNNLFSSRYDFSSSLTAAIESNDTMNNDDCDNEHVKTNDNGSFDISVKNLNSYFSEFLLIEKPPSFQSNLSFENYTSNAQLSDHAKISTSFEGSEMIGDLCNGTVKPSVDSISYKNFLNSYCFFRGSDKINTQCIDSNIQMNESSVHNDSLMSRKKSVALDSLSSTSEFITFPSFSSDTSLFYSQSQVPSTSDSVSSNISKQPSELRTPIDLYYSHLVNSSLNLETPGGTLTAIWT